MKEKIGLKNIYLLLIVIMGLVGLSIYSTYALFTDSLESNEVVSLTAIDLNIELSNLETYKQIELKPYEEKSVLIKLNNSTDILKYYKIWYQMIDPNEITELINVSKLDTSSNNTVGTINSKNTLEIKLIVSNYTKNDIKINLGVNTSETNDIILEAKRNEIFDVKSINDEIKEWSTSKNDFPIGECTKFSLYNKDAGVYKIELWGINKSYVEGSIFLDNTKELYICVGKDNLGNGISTVSLDIPSKEWYLNNNLLTRIMMTGNDIVNPFILTRKSHNDLNNNNITYNINNIKDYYFTNTSVLSNNAPLRDINNNDGYAKISLIMKYKDVEVNNLNIDKVYIDNKLASYPANGEYELLSYNCSTLKSGLSWDNSTHTLSYPINIQDNETCNLYFSSTKENLLSNAKIGDYVDYVGIGGITSSGLTNCDGKECKGLKETDNDSISGWRIAYIGISSDNDLTAYLISASALNNTNSTNVNELAIKYCNTKYIYGANCDNTKGSVWLWNINKIDYARILNYDNDITNCTNLLYNDSSCGFNTSLLDVGEKYWIENGDKLFSWTDSYGISDKENSVKGIRPIIRLDSKVKITAGKGTIDNPYKITNEKGE